MKVAIKEVGIATITISAFRKLCRKNNITKATSPTAITKSLITAFAAFNVNTEVSLATVILMFCALYCSSSCTIFSCTRRLTSTALASVCFCTCSNIVFCWLIRASLSACFCVSCTSAISDSLMFCPFCEEIVRLRNSSTELILPARRIRVLFWRVRKLPVGKSRLLMVITCCT